MTTLNTQNQSIDSEMSWQDHLEELRIRLIWCFGCFLLATIAGFFCTDAIILLLQKAAPNVTFIQTNPGEVFFASIRLAIYTGVGFTLPIIVYHAICFILPGLNKSERYWLIPLTLISIALFGIGCWVGFTVVLPLMLNFLADFGQTVAKNLWGVASYINLATGFIFATGLLFQLPLACVVLNRLGLLTPKKMLSGWRYAILASVLIGAIVTPSADPISQLVMASILLGLYGVSILLVSVFSKKKITTAANLSPSLPVEPTTAEPPVTTVV